MGRYQQGFYKVKNAEKYIGNPDGVVYRSSWERKFMCFLDNHPNVLQWGSEEIAIPYTWCGEAHRYFPDFVVEYKAANGVVRKMLVEIKPFDQTLPPALPKRKTPKTLVNYELAVKTYTKNLAKWEHAKKFCESNGAKFVVLTERELYKQTKNGRL